MINALALAIITILQLSPFTMPKYLLYDSVELTIDKLTIFLLIILLYINGIFERGYIKAFILMLIILFGLLFCNKLFNIDTNQSLKGVIWVSGGKVDHISLLEI